MSATEIRRAFREHLGVERFRGFVGQIVRDSPERNELRFWQDRCWREFVSHLPNAPTELDDIRRLLLWCYIHERALEPIEPRIRLPEIRKADGWHAELAESFPFSFGAHVCPACSLALAEWIKHHDCHILRRKTTWELYRATHESKATPAVLKAIKAGTIAIDDTMTDGDELWETDHGDGMTGLAIVRDGKIKAWWSAPIT